MSVHFSLDYDIKRYQQKYGIGFTGYDCLFDAVMRVFGHEPIGNYIVKFQSSYDEKEWDYHTTTICYGTDDKVTFNDWWEGQRYVSVTHVQRIEDIPVKRLESYERIRKLYVL